MSSMDVNQAAGHVTGGTWVGVLLIGLLVMFSGIMGFVMFSAVSVNDPFETGISDGFDLATRAMTGGMVVFGVVLVLLSLYVKKHEEAKREKDRASQKELMEMYARNIAAGAPNSGVKVRCRYCGSLNEEHDEKCGSCGAAL